MHGSYSMSYVTAPIKSSVNEMIEAAKQMEEIQYFGSSQAFFKLYNQLDGAVFYFMNPTH